MNKTEGKTKRRLKTKQNKKTKQKKKKEGKENEKMLLLLWRIAFKRMDNVRVTGTFVNTRYLHALTFQS